MRMIRKLNPLLIKHFLSIDENTSTSALSDTLPKNMRKMFQKSIDNLTPVQVSQFTRVLISLKDVFAKHDLDLGCLIGEKHSTNMANHPQLNRNYVELSEV